MKTQIETTTPCGVHCSAWLDAAEEIASEYTHTKYKDGVAEIIAKHFSDDVADAERFRWLIKQGVAWRGSYDEHWLPGEWLYTSQDARHFVDKAMAEASNGEGQRPPADNQKPL